MTETAGTEVPVQDEPFIIRACVGLGAALGLVGWHLLFAGPFLIAAIGLSRSHPRLAVFLAFISAITLVLGVLLVAKAAWGAGWRRAIPLVRVSPGLLMWTSFCVLAYVPVQLAWFAVTDRLLGWPSPGDSLPIFGPLAVVLGAPIGEEVLFRGYGLARIRELGGDQRALVLTSLVFALVHGSWSKLPAALLTGLFLGWIVLRSGSLWPALLAHFMNNGLGYLLDRLHGVNLIDPDHASWTWLLATGAAGAMILIFLWLPQVRRRISELNAPP
jgi:membrane protease YdiL (CAAX protease family)